MHLSREGRRKKKREKERREKRTRPVLPDSFKRLGESTLYERHGSETKFFIEVPFSSLKLTDPRSGGVKSARTDEHGPYAFPKYSRAWECHSLPSSLSLSFFLPLVHWLVEYFDAHGVRERDRRLFTSFLFSNQIDASAGRRLARAAVRSAPAISHRGHLRPWTLRRYRSRQTVRSLRGFMLTVQNASRRLFFMLIPVCRK